MRPLLGVDTGFCATLKLTVPVDPLNEFETETQPLKLCTVGVQPTVVVEKVNDPVPPLAGAVADVVPSEYEHEMPG